MEKTELLVSGSMDRNFTAFVNVFPRPAEFAKSAYADDADEEESTIGKMPPQESDDES